MHYDGQVTKAHLYNHINMCVQRDKQNTHTCSDSPLVKLIQSPQSPTSFEGVNPTVNNIILNTIIWTFVKLLLNIVAL